MHNIFQHYVIKVIGICICYPTRHFRVKSFPIIIIPLGTSDPTVAMDHLHVVCVTALMQYAFPAGLMSMSNISLNICFN